MIVTDTESLSPSLHLLVLRRCCSLPILASGAVQHFKTPDHHAHGSSKPSSRRSSSSWGISLANSLGLLNLNSHLLGVLLWLVKWHPLTQDTESPFRRCEQENLPPPFGQAFHSWNQAAVESLGWGGVKGKKKKMYPGKAERSRFWGNWNNAWVGSSGIPL